jgi:hypothetical protein
VIALFLIARLFRWQTLQSATVSAPPAMPYRRGQFWIRRFRALTEALFATLAASTQPAPAPDFVHRALAMLEFTRPDRRSPLLVCRLALPFVGLAARSGSRRPPRHVLLRRGARPAKNEAELSTQMSAFWHSLQD